MAPIRRRLSPRCAAALAVAGLAATGARQTLSPVQRQIRAVGAACRTDIPQILRGRCSPATRAHRRHNLDTQRDALSTDCRAASRLAIRQRVTG